MQKILSNKFFIIIFIFVFFLHQFIFQKFFPNSKNFLGHDYEAFIPYLAFGKIWFLNNFLSIPWFTPSFCCGIPYFADPQSMYYSIQQFIFIIFSPILSIKIIFFIFSLFGYLGTFLLMRRGFKLDAYSSLLCSCLFLFNGFFVYRVISGHLAYLSYIFIPLYCYLVIQSSKNLNNLKYLYIVLSALVFAHFFHSGSGPIILIIFTSILIVFLIYSLLQNSFKIFFQFVQSLIMGTLISLSKITATLFFLTNFPRNYPPTEFTSLISYIKTFFFSFFLQPNIQYFNKNLESTFPFGLHEIEYGISIIPLILIFLFIFLNIKNYKKLHLNTKIFFLFFGIFLLPILLNVNLLNQFQFMQKIPILNSTWTQFRWMAIYIIPLIIMSGFILEKINIDFNKKKYLVITLIFVLMTQNLLRDKTWHINDQKYNMKNIIDFSKRIKNGADVEIKGPAVLMDALGSPKKINNKNDMFFFSYSPLLCYQPIFGYGLEKLNAKKITFNSKQVFQNNTYLLFSDKLDSKDGNLMFFNPSCFLFPDENNCAIGDTFKVSEKDKLLKFTRYEKFEFNQNKIQIFSNYISILVLFGSLFYLVYRFVIFVFYLRKNY